MRKIYADTAVFHPLTLGQVVVVSGKPAMSDATTTGAVENELHLSRDLKLLTGFGFANRASIEAQNYNSSTGAVTEFPHNNNNAWDLQGGLEYKTGADGVLSFSVARKTRFATIKDRYSYSLGTGLPNPYLTPEYSVNYDMGYNKRNDLSNPSILFTDVPRDKLFGYAQYRYRY
jgi:hypothetical protein